MSVKGLRSRPSSGLGPRAKPRSSLFLPESGGSSPEDHHEVKGAAPGGGPSRVRDPLRLSCQLPLRGQLDRASLPLAKELEARRRANRALLAVHGLECGNFHALGPLGGGSDGFQHWESGPLPRPVSEESRYGRCGPLVAFSLAAILLRARRLSTASPLALPRLRRPAPGDLPPDSRSFFRGGQSVQRSWPRWPRRRLGPS